MHNPLDIKPGDDKVLGVAHMEVPVEAVGMRNPVTPSSAAAEQVAVEGLLALASLP